MAHHEEPILGRDRMVDLSDPESSCIVIYRYPVEAVRRGPDGSKDTGGSNDHESGRTSRSRDRAGAQRVRERDPSPGETIARPPGSWFLNTAAHGSHGKNAVLPGDDRTNVADVAFWNAGNDGNGTPSDGIHRPPDRAGRCQPIWVWWANGPRPLPVSEERAAGNGREAYKPPARQHEAPRLDAIPSNAMPRQGVDQGWALKRDHVR